MSDVTIVIPNYNGAAYLEACLSSVFEQTGVLLEVIVVDNGSSDKSRDYIREHFPGVKLSKPQGTYMLFLDCTEWCAEHGKTLDELLRAGWDVGVIWQDGRPFHGPCAIRVNLALPESLVKQAMERLKQYVFQDCR